MVGRLSCKLIPLEYYTLPLSITTGFKPGASRDKYQARIYKGNKEYNLGLFEVAADAALAYDTAHRLVKKITSVTGGMGKEKETLAEYEADKDTPDWLDCDDEEAQVANGGLDPDKLNFIKPQDYRDERARELEESKDAGTQKHKNAPSINTVQMTVRKESIRVVKIIVGASDGGTNNYRARKGVRKPAKDGATLMGGKRVSTCRTSLLLIMVYLNHY